MPTLKIDGLEVTVEPGTNLIEAARRVGKTIPHFCYHPKLSVAGNCRMCLVEIKGMAKPEIGCNTQARDGMEVTTDSEKLRKLRKGVLEFLFLNHPLDCPICDKAGECKLQDYYLEHGKYVSRLQEGKVRKPKRLDIGQHVLLDTERCVLCSRCVRFTDEISKTSELRIFERGSHSQIGIYPDKRLDNRYSLNVTDVCPVGALTSKDFRFSARVWYLERTRSVCAGCANGCNLEVHHYKGKIHRFMPRRNDAVNDTWLCDEGRLSYKRWQGTGRLSKARVKQGMGEQELSLEAAMQWLGSEVGRLGSKGLGFVISPQASLEDNYLLAGLAAKLEAPLFLVGGNPPGAPEHDQDALLIKADKTPNARGARLLAEHFGAQPPARLLAAVKDQRVKALVVLNNDVVAKAADVPGGEVLKGLPLLVALDTHQNSTVAAAQLSLPLASHLEVEGSFVNHAGRVQRFSRAVDPAGEARGGYELIPRLAKALGVNLEEGSPRQVFGRLAGEVPAFAGLSYEGLGEGGSLLPVAPQ